MERSARRKMKRLYVRLLMTADAHRMRRRVVEVVEHPIVLCLHFFILGTHQELSLMIGTLKKWIDMFGETQIRK